MISEEVKSYAEKLVQHYIEVLKREMDKELEKLKKEIEELKVDIKILREGENI